MLKDHSSSPSSILSPAATLSSPACDHTSVVSPLAELTLPSSISTLGFSISTTPITTPLLALSAPSASTSTCSLPVLHDSDSEYKTSTDCKRSASFLHNVLLAATTIISSTPSHSIPFINIYDLLPNYVASPMDDLSSSTSAHSIVCQLTTSLNASVFATFVTTFSSHTSMTSSLSHPVISCFVPESTWGEWMEEESIASVIPEPFLSITSFPQLASMGSSLPLQVFIFQSPLNSIFFTHHCTCCCFPVFDFHILQCCVFYIITCFLITISTCSSALEPDLFILPLMILTLIWLFITPSGFPIHATHEDLCDFLSEPHPDDIQFQADCDGIFLGFHLLTYRSLEEA